MSPAARACFLIGHACGHACGHTSPEHVIVRPRVARLRSDTGQTPVRNRTDTVQTPARCRTDAVPKTGQKPDRHRPEAGQMPCQNTCNGGLRDWESEHFIAGCLVRVHVCGELRAVRLGEQFVITIVLCCGLSDTTQTPVRHRPDTGHSTPASAGASQMPARCRACLRVCNCVHCDWGSELFIAGCLSVCR